MTRLSKGIVLAALQCGLALSTAGKLLYDRATCPRVWVKTMRYDPNLPIRGRYLSLQLAPQPGDPYFERTRQAAVLFFVPEHTQPFERIVPAAEMWAEVTIPRKGPPRPIRLAIKRDGRLDPIDAK